MDSAVGMGRCPILVISHDGGLKLGFIIRWDDFHYPDRRYCNRRQNVRIVDVFPSLDADLVVPFDFRSE